MTEQDNDRYAPKDKIWQCQACGKTSEYDRYGYDPEKPENKVSYDYDISCILNSKLIDKPKGKK